jgi:hypothetical protein
VGAALYLCALLVILATRVRTADAS